MASSPPELSFGRYALKERLAAGGMGEVFVGVQTGIGQFQRPVAVKLMLPHLSEDAHIVGLFLQEARITGQLVHPNVVQVYDVGFEHDRYFLAMELVRGVAASKLIQMLRSAGGQLSGDELAWVARGLCDGLHAAHELKNAEGRPMELVHRDVTPHNLLLSTDGQVKVADFGIARVAEGERLTKPGALMGKLGYLAPEQISGGALDRRVDVFAVGATLYHLATLERPFDTPTGQQLDPRRRPQTPLRVLRPDLPRAFTDGVERALEPAPAARFASTRELRLALPAPSADAGEAFGRHLEQVCGELIAELDQKTERATRSSTGAALVAPTLPPPADRRVLLVVAAGVVAGVMVTSALAWRLTRAPLVPAEPTPTPLVAPAPVAPQAPQPTTPADDGDLVLDPSRPATKPVAEPAKPAQATGSLSVDAAPWGTVHLDGRAVGETPIAELKVSAGPHVLIVKNPDTGRTVQQTVVIRAGKATPVTVDLR
jgi:serine/threonine-protein kinase